MTVPLIPRPTAHASWPSVRAALITLALFVGLVLGLPLPNENARAKLPAPVASFLAGAERAQAVVLAPFAFIGDEFNLTQRWRLFGAASSERYWLWIEGRERRSNAWKIVYRPHDARHDFAASDFEYRRVRGAWNARRSAPQPGYAAFVSWASRRVFHAYPKLVETRVRLEKIEILPRGAGFREKGEFLFEERRTRREVDK